MFQNKVILRSGAAAHWSTVNPKLDIGEIGFELDTRKLKVGDGEYRWNDLQYIYTGSGGSTPVVYSPTTTLNLTDTSGQILIFADASSGNLTVNLPTAVGNTATVSVKKTDSSANTVIIDGNSSETIDGSATKTIEFQNTSITLVSNNSNWFII